MLRKKFSDTPIPRSFRKQSDAYKIVKEFDIKVTGRGRMALKLLIFKNPKDMCLFWKKTLGRDLGGSIKKGYEAQGCVSALMHDVESYANPDKPQKWSEVDPNYFAIMGLCLSHLRPETIVHEAVHAAYAYEKRHIGMFWVDKDELDEERIAYPAGRISKSIFRILREHNLIDD